MSPRVLDPVRPRTLWATLLVAPLAGTTYFMAVYLMAEEVCSRATEGFGTFALRAFAYGATVATVATLLAFAAYARLLRRHGGDGADAHPVVDAPATRRFLGATGLMLGGLFLFFVLLVAAPLVGSSLC